jgi:uncharacterized phage protein (TIGR01671 family)
MREILFRGKTINNEWCEGAYYHQTEFYGDKCDDHYIITSCDELEDNVMLVDRVIPETIGQYTGLNDKNGKRIFEGDIFAHPNNKKYKYVVSWIDDVASFSWFNGDGMGFDNKEIEIIGNIHDNPELLGGDTNV